MSKNEKKIDNKYLKIISILLCGAIGIFLIVGGDVFGGQENESDVGENSESLPDANVYESELENKIVKLCSGVRGVKNVQVVVTLSGGYNAVYAQNSQYSSGGYRNEFVMSGSSKKEPLLIGYTTPEVSGVGIICKGGGDEYIRYEIISLVSAALGINTNKIYVAEGQS